MHKFESQSKIIKISIISLFAWSIVLGVAVFFNIGMQVDIITELNNGISNISAIATKNMHFVRLTGIVVWFIGLIMIFFIAKNTIYRIKTRNEEIEELLISDQMLNSMNDIMFVTDINGKIIRINKAFESITGFSEKEAIFNTPKMLNSNHHAVSFFEQLWHNIMKYGYYSCEVVNRKKNGEIFVAIENISSVRNKKGNIKYFICIMHDITIRKDKENEISRMAHYDALTDLANRSLFDVRLEHAIEHAKRNNNKVVLAYIDIDGFKLVNDTLGHPVGDMLLQDIAKILVNKTRESDTIARLGGDEFCIIFENINDLNEITKMMYKILTTLRKKNSIDGHTIEISASIGISLYPNDGVDTKTLVECADIAMYQCKENGKNNFCFYNNAHIDRPI